MYIHIYTTCNPRYYNAAELPDDIRDVVHQCHANKIRRGKRWEGKDTLRYLVFETLIDPFFHSSWNGFWRKSRKNGKTLQSFGSKVMRDYDWRNFLLDAMGLLSFSPSSREGGEEEWRIIARWKGGGQSGGRANSKIITSIESSWSPARGGGGRGRGSEEQGATLARGSAG